MAWYAAKDQLDAGAVGHDDADHFMSELGWREFSHMLLYHFPGLPRQNLQPRFDKFPWKQDDEALHRWQRGQTGYPIVDAAMRQLWQTGYMHNRLRMIVGSFLVKNLRLHWHHGEAWFWDCLVDADLANNSAGWQWIAGCGADAAPYFRIFNPITQASKFDPTGTFIRHYVPEIAGLPDAYLFSPWEAPADLLSAAGVMLGQTYPRPIVDVKRSRLDALAAFAALKESA
jgi:deoxyribodipyrimidine photo-lyase